MLYNGFSGDRETLNDIKDRSKDAEMCLKADTIIFQRPDEQARLESAILLKKAGKKIVFDNDDTYKEQPKNKLRTLGKKNEILDTFVHMADLVTTTTEFLADEYRKLNKNVVVLPNYIDPTDWQTPKRNESDIVRIGIIGSVTLNSDFEIIQEYIRELSKRKDVRLVMFGLPYTNHADKKIRNVMREEFSEEIKFWKSIDLEWVDYVSIKDYPKKLNDLKLDLMIIPRKDNYFNRCKSNIKFLEASMCGVPCVAQGFGDGLSPYQGKEDQKYMLIAHNEKDFREMTEKLIDNKELRRSMGEKARKYVINSYDIRKHYKEWADAYSSIK
jgi:glycosyltransferase involved in cell wall biosynthesis